MPFFAEHAILIKGDSPMKNIHICFKSSAVFHQYLKQSKKDALKRHVKIHLMEIPVA